MRAAPIALMLTVATPAGAECGNLCDRDWWKTATEAKVQAVLDGGADVMERDENGLTPLHWAVVQNPCKYPRLDRRWCRRHGAE